MCFLSPAIDWEKTNEKPPFLTGTRVSENRLIKNHWRTPVSSSRLQTGFDRKAGGRVWILDCPSLNY